MTAEQIRYWAEQGIEFGAHSQSHADLSSLTPEQLKEEVVGSGNALASLLGSRVISFAYPYGHYNYAALNCVRANFDLAFAIDPKFKGINYLVTDPHLLWRTMVQPGDSVVDVESRARWGFSPLLRLRARLRLRSRVKRAVRLVFRWGH
jgi:peptidoglycan/xylan/chitin deacetylase (PgdA/CDA1 family)